MSAPLGIKEIAEAAIIEGRDYTIKAAIEACEEVVRQSGDAQGCVNVLKRLQELFNKARP